MSDIISPITGTSYSVTSPEGQQLLQRYLSTAVSQSTSTQQFVQQQGGSSQLLFMKTLVNGFRKTLNGQKKLAEKHRAKDKINKLLIQSFQKLLSKRSFRKQLLENDWLLDCLLEDSQFSKNFHKIIYDHNQTFAKYSPHANHISAINRQEYGLFFKPTKYFPKSKLKYILRTLYRIK